MDPQRKLKVRIDLAALITAVYFLYQIVLVIWRWNFDPSRPNEAFNLTGLFLVIPIAGFLSSLGIYKRGKFGFWLALMMLAFVGLGILLMADWHINYGGGYTALSILVLFWLVALVAVIQGSAALKKYDDSIKLVSAPSKRQWSAVSIFFGIIVPILALVILILMFLIPMLSNISIKL